MGNKIFLILILIFTISFIYAYNSQSISLSIPVIINDSNTMNDLAQIYKISPLSLTNKISNEINESISQNDSLKFIYQTYNLEPSKITEIAQNLKLEPTKPKPPLLLFASIFLGIICLTIIIYLIRKK